MKRTAFARRKPLRATKSLARASSLRRSAMKRRPRKVRPAHLRDDAYLAWVRRQRCCAPIEYGPTCPGFDCIARAQAHHETGAGLALRAHDRDAIPLCADHHRDLHEFTGPFRGWSRERRSAWQRVQIPMHRQRYERETGRAA